MTDEETEEEPGKVEKWLTDKLGDNLMSVLSGVAMVIGVLFSLFLFKFIPTICTKPLENITVLRTAVEGILKIAIFIRYLAATGKSKDIRRTYEYHGAEHKTIACLEAHEELTVANVKKQVLYFHNTFYKHIRFLLYSFLCRIRKSSTYFLTTGNSARSSSFYSRHRL